MTEKENEPVGLIYGILDKVADMIISGLMIHKHDAPAVRFFTKLAADPGTILNSHPQDFVLISLGYLMEDHTIIPDKRIVLEGSVIKAAQQLPERE